MNDPILTTLSNLATFVMLGLLWRASAENNRLRGAATAADNARTEAVAVAMVAIANHARNSPEARLKLEQVVTGRSVRTLLNLAGYSDVFPSINVTEEDA